MADSDEFDWVVGEDGCLSVGKPADSVIYHSTLNTIIVTTKEPTSVEVLDVTTGSVLQSSDLSGSCHRPDGIRCTYLPRKDRVLFSDGRVVGVRKDLNGVLLLDTMLQAPVSKAEDVVKIELPLPEANHLFKCLISAELPGVDYVEDVIRELEKEIELVRQATKGNHKVAKWATVTLKLPHYVLKTVCSNLVSELKKLHQHEPGLPVASAVNDRLSYLLPQSQQDTASSTHGNINRELMYSEAARRETFHKWPHMKYKWALPDPMAQAGFYHQPTSSGDDRAMCFTCNVCLVCWEPTDEPWSEHERHSPTCPFVKGEFTQNVPLAVTYASEPAMPHGSESGEIECISNSSCDDYFATSTLHGHIVVWNMTRMLKKHLQFHVDPWEPLVGSRLGCMPNMEVEKSSEYVPPETKEAWGESSPEKSEGLTVTDDTTEPANQSSEIVEINGEVSEFYTVEEPPASNKTSGNDTSGKAEIIEVSGAWKTKTGDETVEISLHDHETTPTNLMNRCRPSQDVVVSSLCVLGSPKEESEEDHPITASPSNAEPHKVRPSLVAGVCLRKSNLSVNDVQVLSTQLSGDITNDVQALNQVNQALSEEGLQIISDDSSSSSSFATCGSTVCSNEKTAMFAPYLLVYDINVKRSASEWGAKSKLDKAYHTKTAFSQSPPTQDMFMPQIMEVDEDPDVQIIGVTPSPLSNATVAKFNHVPSSYISSASSSGTNTSIKDIKPGSSKHPIEIDTSSSGSHSSTSLTKDGRIIQYIDLSPHVDTGQYVHSIVPTLDSQHVIVVTAPKCLNKKLSSACSSGLDITHGNEECANQDADISNGNTPSDDKEGATASQNPKVAHGGCILVFRSIVDSDSNMVLLKEEPISVHVIANPQDAINSLLVLPKEVAHNPEDEDPVNTAVRLGQEVITSSRGLEVVSKENLVCHVAMVTQLGDVKIMDLSTFRVLVEIPARDGDKFVSAAYCTGMDRLCCCSEAGKLYFYVVGPRSEETMDGDLEQPTQSQRALHGKDETDFGGEQTTKLDDLLVKQPLTGEVLHALHQLTEFENLPRFSATVPQCWNEIQQEQQHRRHPQHVQQQGEAMHHTRTWRLQPDGSSWDEHLIELSLLKPCCVGHIDLKFTLFPMCTTPPNVQLTLLKQNISNIGRQTSRQSEVDSKIDFKVNEEKGKSSPNKASNGCIRNNVTDPQFLEKHAAEILCGPLDLASCIDMSGNCGTVTLTSPQLLKVKTRSFLLHVKYIGNPDDKVKQSEKKSSVAASAPSGSSTKTEKQKSNKGVKSLIDQLNYLPNATVPKQKLENIRGCDWMQEISITIRRSKKTTIRMERLQRCAMLEVAPFHEQLMVVACGLDDKLGPINSSEHRQKKALEIMTWITALQMNDVSRKRDASCIVFAVQSNLEALVKACFIEGGRSIAHQGAKLISLCIEYTKNLEDPDLAPGFNFALLQALLESLSLVPSAYSSGALRWFFTLLNRVKCMDINKTGQKCVELLTNVAKHYHDRVNPFHSLLKARFGLYGNPLDTDLFDVEGPQIVKSGSSPSGTSYSTMVAGGATTASSVPVSHAATTSTVQPTSQEETDFKDLLNLATGEKSSGSKGDSVASQVFGLLEVEPLHFTCHATSDGTRMERMDAGLGTGITNTNLNVAMPVNTGLSGTINFVEGLNSVSASAGAAFASLSTAMASAEQQLGLLQQKQSQLMKLSQQKLKLEQKLMETGKNYVPDKNISIITPSAYSNYNMELLPPTPKTTPLFMTPPVTPPNESMQPFMYMMPNESDSGKPPPKFSFIQQYGSGAQGGPGAATKVSSGKSESQQKAAVAFPHAQQLLQPPPPQVLVIERMHSGARRFVVLDFGKPILLTDVIIPACNDLASLSIDVWIQGEESDGQRLVISTDIGLRSLVMNDLMPPPICRYLKITTIGRYSGSTTRSRIPIGSFYGHTFILPWEMESEGLSHPSTFGLPSGDFSPTEMGSVLDQSQILSHMGMFITLQEDIQCRFSLACNRLISLLSSIDMPHNNNQHVQYYLKKGRKNDETDTKVHQAYQDCMQLQLQLNLAQRAVDRLQKALGLKIVHIPPAQSNHLGPLKNASTDKLRVMAELLLDTLLSMTSQTPTIPQLPIPLYNIFNPHLCEALFKNLCINGTRKMQINAGVLLVRLCGNQYWWGEFIGSILQQFFVSEQPEVFPQDRVFILLTGLGQKALGGSRSEDMLESVLSLLTKMLAPLHTFPSGPFGSGTAALDMTLIGWLLLFLSRLLDNVGGSNDNDKGASKDNKENGNNRWDFIQGETAMQNSKQSNSRAAASKHLHKRKMQKKLMYRKQKLLDLQQAKQEFMSAQLEKHSSVMTKEGEAILKEQMQNFKKTLKQYAGKHLKDIMQIRRTDGELLRKLPKDSHQVPEKDGGVETDLDSTLVAAREKCVPVAKGLMALLLSMDFTCNVDLFIITCKVVAKICNVTRPSITLSEVMSQEELEKLVMLTCNIEFNHGNITWGGSWAGHAITCLLQDILEGEKLYPITIATEGITDDEMSASLNETEEGGHSSSVTDESPSENGAPEEKTPNAIDGEPEKEPSILNELLNEDYDNDLDYVAIGPTVNVPEFGMSSQMNPQGQSSNLIKNIGSKYFGPWESPPKPPFDFFNTSYINWDAPTDDKQKQKTWASKLANFAANKSPAAPQGISTAMDSRLDYSIELGAELRLKVMLSVEAEGVQSAICAPLPPPVPGITHSVNPGTEEETDTPLSNPTQQQIVPSSTMLSVCFNNLFPLLKGHRVNMDTLLLTWITLNDDATGDDSQLSFDPSRVPIITLNQTSISSLLNALAWSPCIPIRTWVLAFQTLTLLAFVKCPDAGSEDKWLAETMVSDPNMMEVLIKFLSGTSATGPSLSCNQSNQVGPSASKVFQDFLVRLQLRCSDNTEVHLKELLLKMVYTLTAERGAFHCGMGPLDAQCKLIDHMLEQSYDKVDINNSISVIESIVKLTYQHIITQEKVICKSNSESGVSARSCFSGLFTSLVRTGDSKVGDVTRDMLVCNLLKLVNILIEIPLPGQGISRRQLSAALASLDDTDLSMGAQSNKTDSSKAAAAGNTPTSPINVPKSDEEKISETDEQKTETASNLNHTYRKSKGCTHFKDASHPNNEKKEVCLSDIVLGHQQVMMFVIQTLSCCNSSTMAMILSSSGLQGSIQETCTGIDPLSVGDGVFQILCTLNKKASSLSLILKPLFDYLSSGYMAAIRQHGISKLSEPLLWFILHVLDCETAINTFMEMGGIQILCENLVQSNSKLINTSPSLVSTIMQYLGNGKASSSAKKTSSDLSDNPEGWVNFAPLGTINCSSPKANMVDVLIQASPPHRRARSAAWTYSFYPDEAWVEITISLPCAIQLKEVQIQPHCTALATCPSSVVLEVSRDGTTSIPICTPVQTSGLTFIKLQLLKSEVVTSVSLRLHRPRDASSIGLSQILLMGYTAFGDTGAVRQSNIFTPTEDYVARTSIGWLRLLHHCLTHSEEIGPLVAAAAAPTPNLLVTCAALLASPSAIVYSSNIEAVLLKIGLQSAEMGLALVDNLLRNGSLVGREGLPGLPMHSRMSGFANESTIDILYQLGMTQDSSSNVRLKAIRDWLGDSARVALQRHHNNMTDENTRQRMTSDLPTPAPAHVHCVSAILWQSQEIGVEYALGEIITKDFLSSMYEWSIILDTGCALKKAVDTVICSICHIHPEYFLSLLEWMGIIVNLDLNTDDHKDIQYQHQTSLTDDTKEANRDAIPQSVPDLGHIMLDEAHLLMLDIACQSPHALDYLLESGFPAMLCQALYDFCHRELLKFGDSVIGCDPLTDASKSAGKAGKKRTSSESSGAGDKNMTITADLVAVVLRFLTEVSKEHVMKNWLGADEGNLFWPSLLNFLCNTPVQQPSNVQLAFGEKVKSMSNQQRSAIETATVDFFSHVISCHRDNQDRFARVLCDVIRNQGNGAQGLSCGHSALSGFTRRLFLQVLLEDEKVYVCFKSASQMYKGQNSSSMSSLIQHPRCGAGHKYKVIHIGLHNTCAEIINKVSDTPSLTAQIADERDEKKLHDLCTDKSKKDTIELGLEVVDQISAAAGLTAKERRDKPSSKSSSPPRPASRRGHRPYTDSMHIPVLSLYHRQLPGQPLPEDLTLSQFLTLLEKQGHPLGQSYIEFNMKLRARKFHSKTEKKLKITKEGSLDWDPLNDSDSEMNTDKLRSETNSFPSALQVFAGVGGLALIAEHLPLLYPEITRQASPSEPSRDLASAGATGHEWVTVESNDDLYEELFEPMPSNPPSQPSKPTTPALPTIPPHSLVAFGLFLRLPGYAEVLLRERKKAQCLLRLVLGVTDDGDGGHILTSPVANSLPTLPFNVLKSLFDSTPLTTDDGVLLRRMTLEIGAVHLVLACLSVLSHHNPRSPIPGFHQEIIVAATAAASALSSTTTGTTNTSTTTTHKTMDEKSQNYWAKGTGFGTGSTTSSWDAEQALLRQKSEEEHVTCLLQVLASYINPGNVIPKNYESPDYETERSSEKSGLPAHLPELLNQSCLVPAISSYLRNDSVLDMARHVPLYKALLELLRGIAVCPVLVPLLLPLEKEDDVNSSVSCLLDKMKACVDTYASRLKTNKGKTTKGKEDSESEGLAFLIPDIQETASIVHVATHRIKEKAAEDDLDGGDPSSGLASNDNHSEDERYMAIMKELQFDTCEIVIDEDGTIKFSVPHHYEVNVKKAGEVNNAARARRLAQEAVTLSTSLPLSYNSSVFVRCDEERLDVMKVLITGPSDTPYANGCFEFDVYFPQDYPNSPPFINLETTGNHTVRFNPNLYNDGKVCLSVLNTWHGRPEEKWNPQTSSFLQVLVSIQSLILVSEPYFNEPGYERSRGTQSGTASSREYDANIRQATVKWAMLEQLRSTNSCFKDVIKKHFWLKRHHILAQIDEWIRDMEDNSGHKRTGRTIAHNCVVLKRHFSQLKEELAKMEPPSDCDQSACAPPELEDRGGGAAAAAASCPEPIETDDPKHMLDMAMGANGDISEDCPEHEAELNGLFSGVNCSQETTTESSSDNATSSQSDYSSNLSDACPNSVNC